MRKILIFLLAVCFASPAFADWTGKDASGATITFKNPNVCSSVVCVPITQLTDGTGTAVGTAGAPLRIDPTGTTPQPVAATQTGAWTVNPTTIGNWGLSVSTYNTATPTNAALVEGQYLTAPGTMTSGNSAPLQIDINGNLRTNVMNSNANGPATMANSSPVSLGGLNQSVPINISTATTTQLVALSGSTKVYIMAWDVIAGGTGNITLEYGTGASCGTGTTVLTGAYNLTAQAGIAKGSGAAPVLVVPAGNALCALTSAAVQMSGSVTFQQF
jgi:hypothetical protein